MVDGQLRWLARGLHHPLGHLPEHDCLRTHVQGTQVEEEHVTS